MTTLEVKAQELVDAARAWAFPEEEVTDVATLLEMMRSLKRVLSLTTYDLAEVLNDLVLQGLSRDEFISYTQIGDALGMSRQNANEKYREKLRAMLETTEGSK